MLITKIEVQKKHKNYFNLYTEEDTYLFSVTEDTLLKYGISRGRNFTESELETVQKYDAAMRCLYQSYRYLNIRPHLATELKRKLRQKKYDDNAIDTAIKKLQKQKLLKDEQFIESFIHDQIILKRNGPLVIKQKLFEKGAKAAEIESILELKYPESLQIENAEHLFLKKHSALRGSDPSKIREKLFRHLQQKGFTWPVIEAVFKRQPNPEDEG